MTKFSYLSLSALKAVSAHKLQFLFSCIGVFFGTAFLIAAFAIYNGYFDWLALQKSVTGTDNIIIKPSLPLPQSLRYADIPDSLKASPGLNIEDAEGIREELPDASRVCSDVSYDVSTSYELVHKQATLCGISKDYFSVYNNKFTEGEAFQSIHYLYSKPVCIISSDLKKNIYGSISPIGKWIKCNDIYLQVIGVVEAKPEVKVPDELRIINYNNIIFSPIQTVMLRFHAGSQYSVPGSQYSLLNKITVHFNDRKKIKQSVEVINRLLYRRHKNVRDFRIIIPEHILRRESAKARISMLVTLSVSLICFLMGGITIMNYIFSSFYEQSSRAGLKARLIMQGSMVSFIGSLLGIIVGIIFSKLFFDATKITTIVSFPSIIISFAVSIVVGITFSYTPACKSAVV